MTGSLIELVSDWLSMTTHNSGVFLLDPGLDVVCCILREKGLEHVLDCVYMLLNMHFYVALGFANVEAVAIFMFTHVYMRS
jgi:hypothetical protein